MDLDLRKLRYFAAVAEHRHFGRAARQLFIAQPVLSRQIRALEQELGCDLLDRSNRTVTLTPAGRQLYDDAAGVLGTAAAATRRVHEAARGVERLVIGFTPGLRVSDVVRVYARTHPDVEIQLLHVNWYEQAETVRDGRADVGYLRRPFDDAGLRTTTVGSESKVAVLPATHPLAARKDLVFADLADDEILDAQARRTATVDEKLELVSAGLGIALLPVSVARTHARPDLVDRTVTDVPPVDLCVAIAEDRHQPHLLAFARTAVEVLAQREAVAAS
jgi:DNA-binding transcriptional LysR family regulator